MNIFSWCGNQYEEIADNVDCPMGGAEDSIVLFSDDEGPLLWTDGFLYRKVLSPLADSVYRWRNRIPKGENDE